MTRLAGLDPGRSKCGIVLVDADAAQVLEGAVLPCDAVLPKLHAWFASSPLPLIVVGNGTGSKIWIKQLQPLTTIQTVDEKGSTLEARQRYWELWPTSSWRRLLPEGLCLPPCDLDAIAALVMVERHLRRKCSWPGQPPTFKNAHEP